MEMHRRPRHLTIAPSQTCDMVRSIATVKPETSTLCNLTFWQDEEGDWVVCFPAAKDQHPLLCAAGFHSEGHQGGHQESVWSCGFVGQANRSMVPAVSKWSHNHCGFREKAKAPGLKVSCQHCSCEGLCGPWQASNSLYNQQGDRHSKVICFFHCEEGLAACEEMCKICSKTSHTCTYGETAQQQWVPLETLQKFPKGDGENCYHGRELGIHVQPSEERRIKRMVAQRRPQTHQGTARKSNWQGTHHHVFWHLRTDLLWVLPQNNQEGWFHPNLWEIPGCLWDQKTQRKVQRLPLPAHGQRAATHRWRLHELPQKSPSPSVAPRTLFAWFGTKQFLVLWQAEGRLERSEISRHPNPQRCCAWSNWQHHLHGVLPVHHEDVGEKTNLLHHSQWRLFWRHSVIHSFTVYLVWSPKHKQNRYN